MRGNSNIQKTVAATPPNPSQQTDIAAINGLSAALLIAIPVVLVCAIAGCRKYKMMVQQRRIDRLNRLWQLDSSEKLS